MLLEDLGIVTLLDVQQFGLSGGRCTFMAGAAASGSLAAAAAGTPAEAPRSTPRPASAPPPRRPRCTPSTAKPSSRDLGLALQRMGVLPTSITLDTPPPATRPTASPVCPPTQPPTMGVQLRMLNSFLDASYELQQR
jgi:hypothetical protein